MVGRGVLDGVTALRGFGVLVGVIVGGVIRVGVSNISCGYNCSMASFQESPLLLMNKLNLAAG
jgi:hypothetical protein